MQHMLFIVIAFAALVACVHGQDSNNAADATSTTTSGSEHEHLLAFVGRWELTVEGASEKGVAEIKSILGGRFITEDVKIPFGEFDMEWHGVLGYDRVKKQYTGVWFDNMNNTTRADTGEADETGRIISFRGKHAGNAKFLWRISRDGENAMTIEMFQVDEDGQETPVMNVVGTRKK